MPSTQRLAKFCTRKDENGDKKQIFTQNKHKDKYQIRIDFFHNVLWTDNR